MTRVSLDSNVYVGPDVVFRELDGEAVVLNLGTGLYYGLNDTGTRMWQLLEAHRGVRRVFDALRDEFEVSDDRLRDDLLALLEQLRDKGLVDVTPAAG